MKNEEIREVIVIWVNICRLWRKRFVEQVYVLLQVAIPCV